MIDSVDEIVRVASVEGISADVVKSGTIRIAWTGTQAARLEHGAATDKHWGEPDARLLTPAELDRRICLPDARLAAFTPHCARIHPARYVRGLALVCEGLGVEIYEGCRVVEIRPGQVSTGRATVKAQSIIRATEGYTRSLRGERRTWLPMNSSMIVTEPLGDHVWSHIGWQGAETLGDKAFAHMYAQCTADGRIAIGGRGIPYRFGSRTDHRGHTQTKTVRDLEKVLRQRFPAAAETRVAHAWSGVLAVPRDWCAGVGYDSSTGLGYAGGYVGQGVSTTNLAGRTLCDLVLARDSQLTSLPWVEHRSRAWENGALQVAWRASHVHGLPFRRPPRGHHGTGVSGWRSWQTRSAGVHEIGYLCPSSGIPPNERNSVMVSEQPYPVLAGRPHRRMRRGLVVAIAGACLVLAGCGSGSDDSSSASSSSGFVVGGRQHPEQHQGQEDR